MKIALLHSSVSIHNVVNNRNKRKICNVYDRVTVVVINVLLVTLTLLSLKLIHAVTPRHTMRQIAATRRRDRLLQQIASCDL